MDRRERIGELARVFLKLGATSFGGPAAHVAMMEEEVVRRRGWISRERFLDLLGASNLMPGPNSTELAIHLGRERAGWPGLLVAGASFILPAFVLVAASGPLIPRLRRSPVAGAFLDGVNVASLALMALVTLRLAGAAVVDLPTVALFLASAVLLLAFGLRSAWLLLGGALAGPLLRLVGFTG